MEEGDSDGNSKTTITQQIQTSWMAFNTNFSFPIPKDDDDEESSKDESEETRIRMEKLGEKWDTAIAVMIHPHSITSSVEEVTKTWFDSVMSRHKAKERRYHTLCHLEEMFGYLNIFSMEIQKDDMAVLTMAILFHDVIYNAKSNTNEEDSAKLYQQFASELFQSLSTFTKIWNDSERVVQYILATKSHSTALKNDACIDLFLDIDMSVVGKHAKAYQVYASLIRQEYQHVPHDVYCTKRADVLQSFLTKTIFTTESMHNALEQQAISNIRAEIQSLRQGIIPS